MTDKKFELQAEAECTSPETTAHHGGASGRPFWNPQSFQFMYVPAFQFQPLPGYEKYRYKAEDENGKVHSFESNITHALLTPIWKDIPEGPVKLTVYAVNEKDEEEYLVGARTFFKLSPFRSDLAPAARSYRETATKAYEYAISQQFLLHWLEGTPDPEYGLNAYPSKMIKSVIGAMLRYARLSPENADKAIKIAENAADYLIGITPKDGPCMGVPPTYQFDFRPEPEMETNPFIVERHNWLMFIYPPDVGLAYLELEAATGEKRFFDAAYAIGEYYRDHVEENGSWYLIRDIKTGEVLAPDYCEPMKDIVPFLMELHKRTGESIWKELSDGAIAYIENTTLKDYSWSAQFEDSHCSVNYSNITHYAATALIRYYCEYRSDDEATMAVADDLMRFVEDQFVVWKRACQWDKSHYDTSLWHTPCGLEQYTWHVPIDASTADIASTFLAMYKAGRGELHREKAKALMDSVTQVQRADGMIPTHWMCEDSLNGVDLWINCMFSSTKVLTDFADFFEK